MMKKLILFLAVITLSILASCTQKINLEMYLSEVRTQVYVGEVDEVKITVYGQEREQPYQLDGYVGKLKKSLTVRLETEGKSPDGASVKIRYGDSEYQGAFSYNPVSGKFVTEIDVSELPISAVKALVTVEGEEREIELISKVNADTVSMSEALNSVVDYGGAEIDKMLGASDNSIEVHLRILYEGENNYYYVGITDKSGKTVAYLVDGKTGKVLAGKTN